MRVTSLFGGDNITALVNDWIEKNEDRYNIINIQFVHYANKYVTTYILYKEKGFYDMKYVRTTLDKLRKGQVAIVLEININERKRKKHLLDMGLTRGAKVKIKKMQYLSAN